MMLVDLVSGIGICVILLEDSGHREAAGIDRFGKEVAIKERLGKREKAID